MQVRCEFGRKYQSTHLFNDKLEEFLYLVSIKDVKILITVGDINICYLTDVNELPSVLHSNGIINTINDYKRKEFYNNRI